MDREVFRVSCPMLLYAILSLFLGLPANPNNGKKHDTDLTGKVALRQTLNLGTATGYLWAERVRGCVLTECLKLSAVTQHTYMAFDHVVVPLDSVVEEIGCGLQTGIILVSACPL